MDGPTEATEVKNGTFFHWILLLYRFGGFYTEISKENEDTPNNNSFFLEARDEFAIFTDFLTDPTSSRSTPKRLISC